MGETDAVWHLKCHFLFFLNPWFKTNTELCEITVQHKMKKILRLERPTSQNSGPPLIDLHF